MRVAFPPRACYRCSRERILRILRSFPCEGLDEMRAEPVTTVTCEFCNHFLNSLLRRF